KAFRGCPPPPSPSKRSPPRSWTTSAWTAAPTEPSPRQGELSPCPFMRPAPQPSPPSHIRPAHAPARTRHESTSGHFGLLRRGQVHLAGRTAAPRPRRGGRARPPHRRTGTGGRGVRPALDGHARLSRARRPIGAPRLRRCLQRPDLL